MGAPVRLEAEFFDDPAVDALATLLDYPDRDMAAGKLARLYAWQTEKFTADRPTYAVPRSILIGIFGVRGPDAIVEAGLATLQADGAYKIHGSDKPNGRTPGKTRINWLWMESQAQAERGRRRAAATGDGARANGRFTSAAPAGDQPETSRKHAADQPLTSSLISDLSSLSDLTHTQSAREASTPDQLPLSPTRDPDSPGALVMAAADRLTASRRAIDPRAMPISEGDGRARDVVARLREAGPAARERLEHALRCVEARATATKSIDPLGWASFASEAAWGFVMQSSVEGYAASGGSRAGPRDGQPRRHPPQSASRGQITNTGPHVLDGEIPI